MMYQKIHIQHYKILLFFVQRAMKDIVTFLTLNEISQGHKILDIKTHSP